MNPTDHRRQERLAELFAERSAWVGRQPPSTPAEETAETTVLVVLRDLDLPGLVDGAREFAARLAEDEAEAWRRSWTRARFLFGNPANLAGRSPARLVAGRGGTAWLGPFPSGRLPGPTRLLKPVSGELPPLPEVVEFPHGEDGTTPYRELHVGIRDLTLAEYLVHLHHTLAESVLRGRLGAGEPLRLIHRPDLDADAARTGPAYARVHYAPGGAPGLRLYTWLSPETHP
ncbi:DUF6182 family protein [Kitasatospora sp. SUK 42]|uniref:DUF6182 family protein n=1 Tax=Kitasatospora sp. SUK 42 TaxID=1588882 RepID=UPI0018C8E76E|nr:DUF6182 family protein [Kitasatospora sp. SUK 42]MBV2156634.1 hypothetical protein [Kitasatospora sp. SUK 42]